MMLSIAILIVMGSVLEGAAALIIFGPLLLPVAAQLGLAPLHYGVVLVIAMGIGLFAPPLGLGLYGACLIGNVPIEVTVKPMLGYLGLLLLCLLLIAFVPAITMWLPQCWVIETPGDAITRPSSPPIGKIPDPDGVIRKSRDDLQFSSIAWMKRRRVLTYMSVRFSILATEPWPICSVCAISS